MVAERGPQDIVRCTDATAYLKGGFKGLRYMAMDVTDIRWRT